MAKQPRLQPATPCQLFHQPQIEFAQTSAATRARLDLLRSFAYASPPGGRQYGHAESGFGILRQLDRPFQDVSTKLAPVWTAGSATG